jgi:hypothetical protein
LQEVKAENNFLLDKIKSADLAADEAEFDAMQQRNELAKVKESHAQEIQALQQQLEKLQLKNKAKDSDSNLKEKLEHERLKAQQELESAQQVNQDVK